MGDDEIDVAQLSNGGMGASKGPSDSSQEGLPPFALFADADGSRRRGSIHMEMARALVAETLSAAFQVGASVGASQLYSRGFASTPGGLLMIAFAQAVSYMACSFIFSPHAEGFGSPLLLWASVLVRHPPTLKRSTAARVMIGLVIPLFQLAGSIAGAALADWAIGRQLPPAVVERTQAVPQLLPGVQPAAAFVVEAIAAFWLVLVMSLPQNTARLYTPPDARAFMGGQAQSGDITRPIVAGFVFSVFVFSGGIIVSGVSISPFRWLGAAIVFNFWTRNWWVHVFGPITGFVLAVFTGLFLNSTTK